MKAPVLLMTMILAGTALAGCFGGSAEEFDFVPGKGFKPTGREIKIKMWVEDIIQKEVYPGLEANFWAFCAAPVDPDDKVSASVIEYRDEGEQCSVPGPQLRVKQGDTVIVQFSNEHFHPHTIHWHGQHVPMDADGVPGVTQDSVVQGTTYEYKFVAKRAGTLWYHCHVDGQFHVMMGLYGVIIVEPQDDTWEPKGIDDEYTLVFSTARREHIQYFAGVDPHAEHRHGQACGASGIQGCQNPSVNVEPDVFLLNGVSYPNTMARDDTVIRLDPGDRVRLRLVNTGETFETIHIHGHDMLVTHKDGNPLPPDARYWTETLPIGPAERYDAVLVGDKDAVGAWVVHTHVEQHITNDGQHPGGMHTAIVYNGFEGEMHGFTGAELPGGMAYTAPREIPSDYRKEEAKFFPASGVTSGSRQVSHKFMDVPVPEDVCLLESVYVAAHLHGDSAGLAATSLTLTFKNADSTATIELDQDTISGDWEPEFAKIVAGNYTATLAGTAAEVSVHLSVFVDYFESEAAAFDAGRPCGDDGHGGHPH